MGETIYLLIFLLLFGLVLIAIVTALRQSKVNALKRYEYVEIGMPEDEMLSIMGGGYNKSSLKNNRFKYEWRMNATSYGRYGVRTYQGVKKVDIYIKDGVVEEIRPYNVS